MRLSELRPGSAFVVSRVLMGGEIGKRLADMGFTDGAEGLLVRGAFMRGPIQVQIRGYDLLIRRGEARLIDVAQTVQTDTGGTAAKVLPPEAEAARPKAVQTGKKFKPWRGQGFRKGAARTFASLFSEPDCCRGGERDAARKDA